MRSSVTSHHASVTYVMHQDASASQTERKDSMCDAVLGIFWPLSFFLERLKVDDLKIYNRQIYYELRFRLQSS